MYLSRDAIGASQIVVDFDRIVDQLLALCTRKSTLIINAHDIVAGGFRNIIFLRPQPSSALLSSAS